MSRTIIISIGTADEIHDLMPALPAMSPGLNSFFKQFEEAVNQTVDNVHTTGKQQTLTIKIKPETN